MRILTSFIAASFCFLLFPYSCTAGSKGYRNQEIHYKDVYKNYYNAIHTSNTDLRTFIDMPCNADSGMLAAQYMMLEADISAVQDLMEKIPAQEDEVTQSQEVEAYYGLQVVSEAFIQAKSKSCAAKGYKNAFPSSKE